jgi:hypothetical protein
MTCSTSVCANAGIVMGLMVPAGMAFADPDNLPPGQFPAFAAQWEQWATSIPNSESPLFDTTGEKCMVGQRDFVWFLAGVSGGGSATRTCSVPEDRTLFFPVINIVNINTPDCGQGGKSFTVKQLHNQIAPFINGVHDLSVRVDGKDVKKNLLRRVQSEPFDTVLPADNRFGCPAEVYSPGVDEGYYVALPALTPGTHTIHFHAESDSTAFGHSSQDIAYTLAVVPVSLH